jgi:hypothetical protein
MHPDSAKYLWDVRYAAALVERFIAGKGFDEYASDLLVKSAVERQLEIIGEALNALSRKDPSTAANIAELAPKRRFNRTSPERNAHPRSTRYSDMMIPAVAPQMK